jgi:hypothetical protein
MLVGNWTAPGMGLSFILMAALGGLVGGVALIVMAFQQKSGQSMRVA